jgi:uncharacterized protein (TIGR03118 family)
MSFRLCHAKSSVQQHRRFRCLPFVERLDERCLLSAGFNIINLASDVPGWASTTDPNLVNPWGVAYSPTGPFWFADSGSGSADILDGRAESFALVVPVPSPSSWGSAPTGTVFNAGSGFRITENGVSAPSRFIFATRDGTIAGWSSVVDENRALLAVDNSSTGADYTGLALAENWGGDFLYAADFGHATINVFDANFSPVVVTPGRFRDPNLPQGFAPFNIQNIGGFLFVTYAQRDPDGPDDLAGAGHGFVDIYTTGGTLVRRFASQSPLNSPWGLAQAPPGFGPFGGALLVGNNGDGLINAYDLKTGRFLGSLSDSHGVPIAIPGLWTVIFGNDHDGGAADTLFFTAGAGNERHGLFGAIHTADRRSADTGGAGGFDPHAPGEVTDYPLPPRKGPALLVSSDRPILVANLVSIRDSSLILVPTLMTASGATTTGDTGRAGTGLQFGRAPFESGSGYGDSNETVALGTFIHISPDAAGREPEPLRTGREHSTSSVVRREDKNSVPVHELYGAALETQSEEPSPPTATAAPQTEQQQGEIVLASDEPNVVVQPAVHWTTLVDLLFVLGIPAVGSYWPWYQLRWRRHQDQARVQID